MPERNRIFARARPSLGDALAAHPLLGTHVYVLPYGPDHPYAPPPRGLVAVTVPDVLLSPAPSLWPSDEDSEESAPPLLIDQLLPHSPTVERFPWIRDAVPARPVLAWVRALGRRHRVPIAWYHLLERGDDIYYDLAIVFDHGRERVLLHSTPLGSGDRAGRLALDAHGLDDTPAFDFVLREVWRSLGARGGLGYFPPDDNSRFDWGGHRVPPAPSPAPGASDARLAELSAEEYRITGIRETADARYLGLVGLTRHWPGDRYGGLDGHLSDDSRFYVRTVAVGGEKRAWVLFRQFTSSTYQAFPEDIVAGWGPADREWELLHWVDDMNVHVRTLLMAAANR